MVLLLSLGACGVLTGPEVRDDTCPQTYEFGNYGCARLVVLPGSFPAAAPSPYRWKVGAEGQWVGTFKAGRNSLPEEVQLHVTLWLPLPGGDDTTTVTVFAEARDDSGPVVVGVPLPLFAVDSVRQTVRFAAVGERPDTDTVRLDMRSVDAR